MRKRHSGWARREARRRRRAEARSRVARAPRGAPLLAMKRPKWGPGPATQGTAFGLKLEKLCNQVGEHTPRAPAVLVPPVLAAPLLSSGA